MDENKLDDLRSTVGVLYDHVSRLQDNCNMIADPFMECEALKERASRILKMIESLQQEVK